MKVTKLVIGILQIVLSAFILFQSMAVGVGNALANSKDNGQGAGLIVAICYLVTGIVLIATRKLEKMGGDIAVLVMMLISWLLAISNAKVYSDLQVWGWFAFIIGVGFFVWHLLANKKAAKKA